MKHWSMWWLQFTVTLQRPEPDNLFQQYTAPWVHVLIVQDQDEKVILLVNQHLLRSDDKL